MAGFKSLPEEEILFLLDKCCVGDIFYNDLSMVCNDLPKSYLIKQCRNNLKNICHIQQLSHKYDGARLFFLFIADHITAFINANPTFDAANEKLRIKINGDGARMTRNYNSI